MALTKGRITKQKIPGTVCLPMKGSTTIFAGSLVMLGANGYAIPAATAVGGKCVGRAMTNGGTDRWINSGSDGDKSIEVEEGVFGWENSSSGDAISADDIGKACYAVDDQTVALTDGSGTRSPAGIIRGVEGGQVFVSSSLEIARQLTAVAPFVSAEQTGTGSAQNVAHGLGVTPSKVLVAPTDTSPSTTGAYTVTEGSHDATNVVVTVTSGKKFKVIAWP